VYSNVMDGYAAVMDAAQLAAVQAEPGVQFVDLDPAEETPPVNVAAPPPSPEQTPQVSGTSVGRIDADESSAVAGDGKGLVNVNVAVLDTGVQPDHPDLNVVNGFNCIGPNVGTNSKDWADPAGHGTLVAGFLGARDNKIARLGIAPGVRISAVRVLDAQGFGFNSDIICGMDWVAGTRIDGPSNNDVAVANFSLGGPDVDDGNCGRTLHRAFHYATCGLVAHGVTVVAAAGNETTDFQGLGPATYSEVLTVTAMADRDAMPGGLGGQFTCDPTQFDDTIANFSNFATLTSDNAHVVSAPGTCIANTSIGSGTGIGSGTSFASPQAAGVVALCIAYGPCAGLTPAQIVARIVSDAEAYNLANPTYGYEGDPLRPQGDRYYGYLVNAGIY
jgi:subtilisin family serine protease